MEEGICIAMSLLLKYLLMEEFNIKYMTHHKFGICVCTVLLFYLGGSRVRRVNKKIICSQIFVLEPMLAEAKRYK